LLLAWSEAFGELSPAFQAVYADVVQVPSDGKNCRKMNRVSDKWAVENLTRACGVASDSAKSEQFIPFGGVRSVSRLGKAGSSGMRKNFPRTIVGKPWPASRPGAVEFDLGVA
jgi:hypothetical protein